MFLLAVKRKFIISLTILMVVLSWGGALVFHTLLPRYYFAWYPSIPIFFYLFGLFYIFMFGCCYRVSPQKMVAVYLVAKVTKMMLSILIMSVYAVAVAHQVLSFIGTYMVLSETHQILTKKKTNKKNKIIFLIFETRFFFHFEIKHKSNRYKYK